MLTHDIREHFLSYFAAQQHAITPSAPLIPHHDPTLLFVNAGMVPFKNMFTGAQKPASLRAVSSQKCVRAGGKHNDLENVGYTARHHTFFEMLGNFSFGDYFKKEAILYAWTFITKELGISPEKLCVTVFSEDEEAATLWKKIAGLPDHKIIPIATSDNFWSMGDTGPCGPCTEIFYDHGENIPGGPPGSAAQDGDRFVEIWNLVFMQYDQLPSGERILLPKPSIDTGMGIERIAAVMQGVHDNYDTDIFKALMDRASDLTSTKITSHNRPSFKVLADHVRAGAFLMADGVLPSNEGRGYVLRRILRRAMRHAYFLGARDPLLVQMIPTLIEQMGKAYPELHRAHTLIESNFDLEERRFQQTLEKGLSLLTQETALLREGASLSGKTAFKLYDTFGFPIDLTQDILKEQGRSVDEDEFHMLMDRQKTLARASWAGSGEHAVDDMFIALKERTGETFFLGYDQESAEVTLLALYVNGTEVDEIKEGERGYFVTDRTPFYGESGGQIGDTGEIVGDKDAQGKIVDTQKKAGLLVHTVEITHGSFGKNHKVLLTLDAKRRQSLKCHHSATHLLHQALRQILGDHVTQRGSLVTPEKLRFDFSHTQRLTSTQILAIEHLVNQAIRANYTVTTRLMAPVDAIQAGALALFGEKYGDEVRVVSMAKCPKTEKIFSTELCGGTHVSRTGEIGLFKIVSEGSVASGVRRIEAMVERAAEKYVEDLVSLTQKVSDTLKVAPLHLQEKVEKLMADYRALQQEIKKGGAVSGGFEILQRSLEGGISLVAQETQGMNPQAMKGVVDILKQKIGQGVVVAVQRDEERTTCVIGIMSDLPWNANTLLKALIEPLGGKGGGRPDLAQGGWSGKVLSVKEVFEIIEGLLDSRSVIARSD